MGKSGICDCVHYCPRFCKVYVKGIYMNCYVCNETIRNNITNANQNESKKEL